MARLAGYQAGRPQQRRGADDHIGPAQERPDSRWLRPRGRGWDEAVGGRSRLQVDVPINHDSQQHLLYHAGQGRFHRRIVQCLTLYRDSLPVQGRADRAGPPLARATDAEQGGPQGRLGRG